MPGQYGHCPLQPGQCLVQLGQLAAAEQAYLAALALEPSHQDARYNLTLLRAQPPEATPQAQDPKPSMPRAGRHPGCSLPPSPPVLLLEQRLRKEDQRRRQQETDRGLAPGTLKGEDPW